MREELLHLCSVLVLDELFASWDILVPEDLPYSQPEVGQRCLTCLQSSPAGGFNDPAERLYPPQIQPYYLVTNADARVLISPR